MTVWAAVLRGVNVGGAGRLPMAEFRSLLAGAGLDAPQTHIQSGNAVFASDRGRADLADLIGGLVFARFGFRPPVLLKSGPELKVAPAHPFGGADAAKVHAYFLAAPPGPVNDDAIAALASPTERWALSGDVFLLHAPDGVGRSSLANRLHQIVPGIVTARNLRSVGAIAAMMRSRG